MEKIMDNEQYISTAVSRIQQPKKSMKEKVCFYVVHRAGYFSDTSNLGQKGYSVKCCKIYLDIC